MPAKRENPAGFVNIVQVADAVNRAVRGRPELKRVQRAISAWEVSCAKHGLDFQTWKKKRNRHEDHVRTDATLRNKRRHAWARKRGYIWEYFTRRRVPKILDGEPSGSQLLEPVCGWTPSKLKATAAPADPWPLPLANHADATPYEGRVLDRCSVVAVLCAIRDHHRGSRVQPFGPVFPTAAERSARRQRGIRSLYYQRLVDDVRLVEVPDLRYLGEVYRREFQPFVAGKEPLRPARGRAGRPQRYDPKKDQRIADAKAATGQTDAELAREFRMTRDAVRRARDRHRHRCARRKD